MVAFWAMFFATILYIIVGVDNGIKRDWPHCGLWLCYATANAFMLYYEYTKIKN